MREAEAQALNEAAREAGGGAADAALHRGHLKHVGDRDRHDVDDGDDREGAGRAKDRVEDAAGGGAEDAHRVLGGAHEGDGVGDVGRGDDGGQQAHAGGLIEGHDRAAGQAVGVDVPEFEVAAREDRDEDHVEQQRGELVEQQNRAAVEGVGDDAGPYAEDELGDGADGEHAADVAGGAVSEVEDEERSGGLLHPDACRVSGLTEPEVTEVREFERGPSARSCSPRGWRGVRRGVRVVLAQATLRRRLGSPDRGHSAACADLEAA